VPDQTVFPALFYGQNVRKLRSSILKQRWSLAHLGSVLPRCPEFAYAFVSTFCAEAEEIRERPHQTRERGACGVAVRIGLSIECAHPSTCQPIFAGPVFRALRCSNAWRKSIRTLHVDGRPLTAPVRSRRELAGIISAMRGGVGEMKTVLFNVGDLSPNLLATPVAWIENGSPLSILDVIASIILTQVGLS
jgi:hypothetical protein